MFRLTGRFDAYTVGFLIEKAWLLRARCDRFHHEKRWTVDQLRAAFPPATAIPAICAKLTCAMCGSTEGLVDVLQDHS